MNQPLRRNRLTTATAPSSRTRLAGAACLIVTAYALLPGLGLWAADWPGWLGPNRDGSSPETGLLDRFPANGPDELWRQPIGAGFSGLAVRGQQMFTQFSDGSDEYAACYATADGSLTWRTRIGHAFYDKQGGDGPRATPAIDGDAVFVLSAHGTLVKLDAANGKIDWQKSLTEDFDSALPNWGFSASPLVADGTVYVSASTSEDGALLALQARNGRTVWRSRPGKTGYASPITLDRAAEPAVVFFAGDAMIGASAKDGSVAWEFPWKTAWQANAATPLRVGSDRLFITSSYGRGGAMLRLGGSAPETLWKNRFSSQFGTPVSEGTSIYGFDGTTLTCLDAADGSTRWMQRGFGKGTLILADGKLFILSERGRLILARASGEGFVSLGETDVLNGRCWTAPSLADGKLFLRGPKEMLCLRVRP